MSLQPNAGSQGEFAGLLAIRAYHRAAATARRDVCLIPASAHGTNAASAVMAGMRVVVVRCDDNGNIDLDHLRSTVDDAPRRPRRDHDHLPVDARRVRGHRREVCGLVHDAGGQVYVDGANLNALIGLARLRASSAPTCHT